MSVTVLSKAKSKFITVIEAAIGKDIRSWLKNPNKHRVLQVLPGITNEHKNYDACMEYLAQIDEHPKSQDGFLEYPFITQGPGLYMQKAGYSFSPKGLNPPPELLDASPSPELLKIWSVLSNIFKGVRLTSIAIPRDSTTSTPLLSKEFETKDAELADALSKAEDVIKLCASDITDGILFEQLARMNIFNVFLERRRLQPEKVDLVNGTFVPKLRQVYDHFRKLVTVTRTIAGSRLFRLKARLVYAMSFKMNQIISPFVTWWRQFWFTTPVYNVLHVDQTSLGEELKGFPHIKSFDVSNFDWNLRSFFTDLFIDSLRKVWSEDVIKTIIRVLRAGMYGKDDYDGKAGIVECRHPDESTLKSPYGNPSGWTGVADFGKHSGLLLFCEIICHAVNEFYGDPFDDRLIYKILTNGDPRVRWKSASDDNLVATKTRGLMIEVEKHAVRLGLKYKLPIVTEETTSFCGLNFIREGDNVKVVQIVQNILTKRLLAEQDVVKSKRFPDAGFWLGMLSYASHPRYEDYFNYLKTICARFFGARLDDLYKKIDMPIDNRQRINVIKTAVMDDPSLIHHRVDISQLDAETKELLFISVPPTSYRYAKKRINKGVQIAA